MLFLSRVAPAKGVFDLVHAYRRSGAREQVELVLAGTGPALPELRNLVEDDDRIHLLDDVDDDEKPLLMAGSAAYALPTRPEPDFVETFGIALAEAMLSGGGPVITTLTGGTGEAVGDTALIVPAGDVEALARALDRAVLEMTPDERRGLARRAREHALAFDRGRVFDGLFPSAPPAREVRLPDEALGAHRL